MEMGEPSRARFSVRTSPCQFAYLPLRRLSGEESGGAWVVVNREPVRVRLRGGRAGGGRGATCRGSRKRKRGEGGTTSRAERPTSNGSTRGVVCRPSPSVRRLRPSLVLSAPGTAGLCVTPWWRGGGLVACPGVWREGGRERGRRGRGTEGRRCGNEVGDEAGLGVGEEHTRAKYIRGGKTVFFITWTEMVPPCWSAHLVPCLHFPYFPLSFSLL